MAVSLREILSFGRYEPLFRIASGGMAEVYAAQIHGEAGFQKMVAVKRMHPHLAHDQSFVDMFLNEARLAAHIASPHVVQTLDLGRGSDGSLYIVMELVVGISLAGLEIERKAALPVPIAIELMAQAAQGLDDAHDAMTPAGDELGLIHRDVSPHNILVGVDGRAKVTDFGIARAVHAPRAETNVKELKGKFAYMSPEQTRLHPLDRRSDVFSLGVVLWEALVGRRLFAVRDPADCIRNVRKKVVPAPHEMDARIPPAISRVVLRSLERLPSARYQSGADLAEALRRVGRGELGRLPDRKTIAAFVKQSGGEELDRLQRLIRLGSEGAAPDAMEAVRPGSTMVLGADGSGVSRVGTRTDEMDPASLPKITTVILPEDEEDFAHDTSTAADLDDADLEFLSLSEHQTPLTDDDLFEPTPPPQEPEDDDPIEENPTRQFKKVASPIPAPVVIPELAIDPPPTRSWMAAGAVAGIAVLAASGLGLWLFLREEPQTVLPSARVPTTRTERTVEPAPPMLAAPDVQPATEGDPPSSPSAEARVDETLEQDDPQTDDAREPADEDEPTSSRPSRSRRRSRRRARGRNTPARSETPTREPSGERPVLLDVSAFDHVAP